MCFTRTTEKQWEEIQPSPDHFLELIKLNEDIEEDDEYMDITENLGDDDDTLFVPPKKLLASEKLPLAATDETLNEDFNCSVCQRVMSGQKSLARHMLRQHAERTKKCPHCKNKFNWGTPISPNPRLPSFRKV